MSSEATGETITVKTEEAGAAAPGPAPGRGEWKCPMGDRHVHRDDVRKAWKECQEESFWYRALPFSVGSMAVTGGLIYNGIWQSSKRFGPFPKLAVAGILGYAAGKASYAGTCRAKFKEIGLGDGPGFGPGFGPWSEGRRGGPFKNSGHGHRCHHVCEECKKKAEAAPVEEVKS
ncbi:OCIA domain-containing protein 2 [Sparus aurata]|uniref:OCIA domain containing 2 n=1 Tax=Sparus aurata TaxID=8175 RepID=A0A671YB54_SPAAU|nr:OCIA domain-containing protein 2 [Sparus aurata]XP_030288171.1 OCIA domain-containing protein 2 [Sparus aurata]